MAKWIKEVYGVKSKLLTGMFEAYRDGGQKALDNYISRLSDKEQIELE